MGGDKTGHERVVFVPHRRGAVQVPRPCYFAIYRRHPCKTTRDQETGRANNRAAAANLQASALLFPANNRRLQGIYRNGGAEKIEPRTSSWPGAWWAPGAIPTVDFLLHHPGAVVKKMAVKSY